MKIATWMAILLAPTCLSLVGCASAFDPVRNGNAVSQVTIRQLLDDPDTWDGKWVRIEGWFDKEKCVWNGRCVVEDESWWSQSRNYSVGYVGVSFSGLTPTSLNRKKVVVSGRVEAGCYIAIRQQEARLRADPSGPRFHPNLSCRLVPVLEHAIMQAIGASQ